MSKFVHDFVKKMTIREKAYFKRFSQLHSGAKEKNYLLVYDFIEKMPFFDQEKIKNHFGARPIGKHLNSELNYLMEQLLKSMTNFHLSGNIDRKLHKSILYLDILLEKGFRKQAFKILKKAKSQAYKFEKFTTILNLIEFEEKILFKQGILGFTKDLEDLDLERNNINAQIRNLNILRLIREQIRELWFSVGYINDTSSHPYFYNNSLLENKKEALSLHAKEHWLYIRALKFYISKDFENAKIAFIDAINFLQDHEYLFDKSKQLAMISNYLYNCALSKDLRSFDKMLLKLEELYSDQGLDQKYINYIKYSRSYELYYSTNDNISAKNLTSEVKIFIAQTINSLEQTQSNYIYFLMVRACIINNEFAKASTFINEWLKLKLINYYILHIRLFILILHLELGNINIIESEIDTTRKSLKRHDLNNELSKAFLSFFRSYYRAPEKLKQALLKLKSKLENLNLDAAHQNSQAKFNYINWINQKIERLDSN